MKKITTHSLEKVFEKIIEKLEFEGYKEIEINDDLYRIIPTDSWEEFGNVRIENGSLFDDLELLEKLAHDQKRKCTYVDFDRFASLLRYISQKNNSI